MTELHEALTCLRPKDFGDVPTENLKAFLPDILSKAELIANSVPPPPNGTPYESSTRTRTEQQPATSSKDLTTSKVRRPPPAGEHEQLQKSWGKPVKLGSAEAATGMSVFKMAGNDRHGAWFSRSSVHEGLGFEKWKRAMKREFPESLEVQGGPGEGNVRGIGGDQRLEDMTVDGVGHLQVYQLSAQFPGPTSPREFITLLITSDSCLSDASKVGNSIPRHFMVVSIPVAHSDAQPRQNMVRGSYESVEMIREIPLGDGDAETNPVEWVMVTRSDPGGGIPRFMVERNVPSSIVQDAVKFLDWACAKDDDVEAEVTAGKDDSAETPKAHDSGRNLSLAESNGITAGVGTSIADRPTHHRRISHQAIDETVSSEESLFSQVKDTMGAYIPASMNPLARTESSSSSSTSSSAESFASAEQYTTAPDGPPVDRGLPVDNSIPTPSDSQQSLPLADDPHHGKGLHKIEEKKEQLKMKLEQAREKSVSDTHNDSQKTDKEIQKANAKHEKEKKKQEDKYHKEMRKLEERRQKETRKLLAKQQKEADKNQLGKAQRERDEYKQRTELLEQENKLLREQLASLQQENTAIVARLGKSEEGIKILRLVKEEDTKTRARANSGTSASSSKTGAKSKASSESASTLGVSGTAKSMS
ncbi:hypothetical protein BDW02DRAFT_530314 [Decorospora gaudefroyi]|uniref:DUF3074 domain-containing protein n=1 Tax=Decorospora gaudefroyi TaxID=184978 RepID=A0A6A5KBG0_9PLEO|nr:hypothetical protein BDW02DRAFT_530314 [Decorospora gaudefroyi]